MRNHLQFARTRIHNITVRLEQIAPGPGRAPEIRALRKLLAKWKWREAELMAEGCLENLRTMTVLHQEGSRFIYEFRTTEEFENRTLRGWLHDSRTFMSYATRAAALADARAHLEADCAVGDEPTTIIKWGQPWDNDAVRYPDDGVWYELSDGEAGRVLIHEVLL